MDILQSLFNSALGGNSSDKVEVNFTAVYAPAEDPTEEHGDLTGVETTTAIADILAARAAGKSVIANASFDGINVSVPLSIYGVTFVSFSVVVPDAEAGTLTTACIFGYSDTTGNDTWMLITQ